MLQFRNHQVRDLHVHQIQPYLFRVEARVRNDFPDEFSDESHESLFQRIEAAFDRMLRYGFERKEHLHRLIVLELLYGPAFEKGLPEEARTFAFPEGTPQAQEGDRFWAVYQSAGTLRRHKDIELTSTSWLEEDDV